MTEPRQESHAPRLPADLVAIAASLERAPADAPRFLRERVLGAVIDVLAEPEDATLDLLPPVRTERWREAIAALSVLVALLLVGPLLGVIAPPPPGPRPPHGQVARTGALHGELPPAPPARPTREPDAPLPAPLSALALRTITVERLEQGDF